MITRFFADNLKVTLIRNSFIALLWWITFYPGFYSADSFGAIKMAQTGQLNDSYSAPWAIFVRIFTIQGHEPSIVTLLDVLLLTVSLTVFAYSILSQRTAAIVSTLLGITPLVGAMGITMWHDIPMTSGFLLIITFLIRSLKDSIVTKRNLIELLLPGALLITFRLNGTPTILILLLVLLFMEIPRSVKAWLASSIVVALVFTSLTTLFTTTTPGSILPISWMAQDISCYASTPAGVGFVEKAIPGVGNTETWKSTSWCTWFNDSKLSPDEMLASPVKLISAMGKLVRTDPLFVISLHAKRNKYLIPVPIYGLPHPPFIHSTIEFPDQGISWAFPKVVEKARDYVRLWNFASPIFAWSGAWLLFLYIYWFRSRRKDILLITLLSTAQSLSLLVVAEISDGRYALFTLIAGQVLALGLIVDYLIKRKAKL